MSLQAMSWVIVNENLLPLEKFVLLAIADNSSLYATGGCSINTIKKFTNLNFDQSQDIVFSLLRQNLIEVSYFNNQKLYKVADYILEQLEPSRFESNLYKKKKISKSLREKVFRRDSYKCLRCGCSEKELLRADHIIPESKQGETSINNLQTLCLSCNSWKGVKTIDFRGGDSEYII